jgi:lipoyl(octanoyl) transferase
VRALACRFLGRVRYAETAALQERLRAAILDGDEDAETLLLLEHEPVITLGRGADRAHVLASAEHLRTRGVDLVESSRGGDVTWHGPGQLVAYPVMRLRAGVVAHVRAMAQAVIEVAAAQGLTTHFRRSCPGVWMGPPVDEAACPGGAGRKLAAFGVHVHRRVAVHGVALNVATAPDAFATIVPCGLAASTPTSLAAESGRHLEVTDLVGPFADAFCRAVGRRAEFAQDAANRTLLS